MQSFILKVWGGSNLFLTAQIGLQYIMVYLRLQVMKE